MQGKEKWKTWDEANLMAHRNPYRLAQYPPSRGKSDGFGFILFVLVLICALIRNFLETPGGQICCIIILIMALIFYFQNNAQTEI